MKYINYIKGHKLLVILLCLIAVALYAASNYSFLIISGAPDQAPEQLTLTATENGAKEKALRNGINIVRRGNYSLRATKGMMKTTAYPRVRALRVERLYVSFENQKVVEKVAPNQVEATCLFGDVTNVYIYCSGGKLFKRQAGDVFKNQPYLTSVAIQTEPVPYKDGILSFITYEGTSEEADNYIQLAYISLRGVSIIEPRVSKFIGSSFGKISVHGNEFLITNDATKKLYYFSDYNKQPIDYSFAKDASNLADSSNVVGVLGEGIAIVTYNERPTVEKDEFGEQMGKAFGLTYVVNDKIVRKQEAQVIGEGHGDNIGLSGSGKLLVFHDYFSKETVLFNAENLKKELMIPNTDLAVMVSNNLYYTQSDMLYRYDTHRSMSYLLRETGLAIDSLVDTKDGVLFTGSHSSSLATLSTYFSSASSVSKSPTDPLDLMNDTIKELPVITSDYSSKSIFFAVLLDSAYADKGNGSFIYDNSEYVRKKELIIKQLKESGLDISSYKLYFKAGP